MGRTVERKGVFICIEGLDASGKTTHSKLLVKNLRGRGVSCRYTREPSRGPIGRLIEGFVLKRKSRINSAIEALLFSADRLDHLEREVIPALERGDSVVCDRYVYSTVAYQGAASLDLSWIEEINRFALKPDMAIYIDVPPEVVIVRLGLDRSVMERIETQKRVREIYLRMVDEEMMIQVDGNRDKKEVHEEILESVTDLLRVRGLI